VSLELTLVPVTNPVLVNDAVVVVKEAQLSPGQVVRVEDTEVAETVEEVVGDPPEVEGAVRAVDLSAFVVLTIAKASVPITMTMTTTTTTTVIPMALRPVDIVLFMVPRPHNTTWSRMGERFRCSLLPLGSA